MKKFQLALQLMLLVAPFLGYASHGAGAELRYECLGGNNYRFYFTFYRDCYGIQVNQLYDLRGTSSCGPYFDFSVRIDSMVEVSQMCATEVTNCVNFSSPNYGVEAYYYHVDTILPYACNDWTFGLDPAICNRNQSINNLTPNGSTYCLYVQATLNNTAVPYNSSPVFAAIPLFHLCNQIQYVHLYAHDPDGDSLAFEMYTPHSDALSDVVYIPGLSATQPVTFATAADSTRFDPATGDIRFEADGAQITVVGVRVNEFRNGFLIGSEERDIQVNFDNCSYNAPTVGGINGPTSYTYHICVDSLLTFQVHAVDVDPGDTVHVSWQDTIPGSFISVAAGSDPYVTFTWQAPDSSYMSSVPYTFILSVTDSTCPYVYFNSYLFNIYVDSCYAITEVNNYENKVWDFSASYSESTHAISFIYKLDDPAEASVALYDMTGRKIKSVNTEKVKEGKQEIDASDISPGVYLLSIETDQGVLKSQKVVVE